MNPSQKFRRLIKLAKRIAWQSDHNHKHCCIIFKGGNIISISANKNAFNSLALKISGKLMKSSLHAELGAVLGLPKETTHNSDALVIRINNSSKLMLSKPCINCQEVLRSMHIKRVFYSTGNGEELETIKL